MRLSIAAVEMTYLTWSSPPSSISVITALDLGDHHASIWMIIVQQSRVEAMGLG
jgi:hypothetical protein